MPELPEVEVTRRSIEPHLVGRRIRTLRTTSPSYFFLTPPSTLKRQVEGKVVCALARHGKYLVATLDDSSRLLLHLGMTGQLFTSDAKNAKLGAYPDSHTHLCFEFENSGTAVFFRDVRKFGKVRWLAPGQSDARLDKLGPDALIATGTGLHSAAVKRKVPIKSLLLDQSVLAGVGNIYADEALFLSGIRPTRPSWKVSRKRLDTLAAEVVKVLQQSIALGGSSISDFVAPDGNLGSYQNDRQVYGREGETCRACPSLIRRLVIAQRSTHYCPRCQR